MKGCMDRVLVPTPERLTGLDRSGPVLRVVQPQLTLRGLSKGVAETRQLSISIGAPAFEHTRRETHGGSCVRLAVA